MQVILSSTIVKHSVDGHLHASSNICMEIEKKLERKGLYNSRAIADGDEFYVAWQC